MPTDRGEGVGKGPSPARRALKDQDALWDELARFAAAVGVAVRTSARALSEGRPDLAAEVKDQERSIDLWEIRIEQECLRVLALYDPTASDLRRMVGVLKIANVLERMADLAAHVAKRVKKQAKAPNPVATPEPIIDLARRTADVVEQIITALAGLDVVAAQEVMGRESAIHRDRNAARKGLKQGLRQEPELSNAWLRLLNSVRNLERIADHAAHIAEIILYIKEGRIVRHVKTPPPSPAP